MGLKSMKLSKEGKKSYSEPTTMADAPQYPWGLNINLDTESIKKLGIKMPMDIGEKVSIVAKAEVVSISLNDGNGGKRANISLQITDMDLIEGDSEKKDSAKKLYGE